LRPRAFAGGLAARHGQPGPRSARIAFAALSRVKSTRSARRKKARAPRAGKKHALRAPEKGTRSARRKKARAPRAGNGTAGGATSSGNFAATAIRCPRNCVVWAGVRKGTTRKNLRAGWGDFFWSLKKE